MDREVDARWERFKASLAQHLKTVPCKATAPLDKYYDAAKKVLSTAERYEETNNQRSTYMFYYRFASLCVHTIASHPRYHDRLFREEKIWAIEETKKAMNELENIKASMRESWKADLLDRERRASERAAEEERKRKEKERMEKEKLKADSETKIVSPPKLDSPISKSDSTYLDAMRSLNIGRNLYPVKSETENNTPASPTQRSPADAAASSSKRKSGIYPVLEEPTLPDPKSKPTTSSSSLYPSLDELNTNHSPKPPSYDNVAKKKSTTNLPPPSYDDISSSSVAKDKKNIVSVRIPPNTRPGQMLQVRDPETGRIFKISVRGVRARGVRAHILTRNNISRAFSPFLGFAIDRHDARTQVRFSFTA